MDNLSEKQVMSKMIVGAWITQGIYVASELGIADILKDGPLKIRDLASKTNTNPDGLYRLIRALASMGIFSHDPNGNFSNTPLSEYLRKDHPDSGRALAQMMGEEFYQLWGNLFHSVQTGKEAVTKVFGKAFFDYMTENPARHRIYDSAMNGVHGPETQPMLDAYDFSRYSRVADIGGGNGLLLRALLKRYPNVKGVLFDLPSVAEGSKKMFEGSNLSSRHEIIGGDFFKSLPEGNGVYIMRHIIHDWQDDDAIRILKNCRKVMKPDSKLLIIETVIPEDNIPSFGKWLDLMMLLVNGRERTEKEYRRIISGAGLKLKRIIPTSHEVSIIEVTI